MADFQITSTETSAVGIDMVSAFVQATLNEQSILISSIEDRSAEVSKGVKTLDIGRRSGFTAETKAEGTEYSAQKFTWTADTLSINKQKGVYTELTTKASNQSMVDQEMEILKGSAQALVNQLEADVFAELIKVSASAPDHVIAFGTASTIALSDILEARKLLRVQNVPMDNNMFLAINPAQEAQLLALEQFIDASRYSNADAIQNGELGRIYGFRVLVSNAVTASNAVAYSRSHVAFARQLQVAWESQRLLKDSVTSYLLETFYGLKVLDAGKRGVLMNNAGTP